MTCLSEIEGNPTCAACGLKRIIRQDDWNTNYLQENKIPQGVQVETKPKDAWVGMPKRQVVYCGRGLGIPIE